MKIKETIVILVLVIIFGTSCTHSEKKQNALLTEPPTVTAALSATDQTVYDLLQQRIDDGDCIGFAEILLNHKISNALFSLIIEEDVELIETVLLDAMLTYAEYGQLDKLVQLRQNGFLTDRCFLNYWEVTGSVLPDEGSKPYDVYLVHELTLAFMRDSYTLRLLMQMRDSGIIDDSLHTALIEALGFDYTDQNYIEENQLSPLQSLTPVEKAAYETILVAIDEGDCLSVIECLLSVKDGENVYALLHAEEAELIEFVIAQGMGFLSEEYRFLELVTLRANGFVSDDCFESYWEMTNSSAIDRYHSQGVFYDTDMYLLCELEEIANTIEEGTVIVKEILQAGVLNEGTYYAVIEQLGLDIE